MLPKLAARRRSSSVAKLASTLVNKVQYVVEVGVGTPAQKLEMLFDTGWYVTSVLTKGASNEAQSKGGSVGWMGGGIV